MKTITPQKIFLFIRDYDIAIHPAPEAIFDPLSSGFNIWATQTDHPAGREWNEVVGFMDQGAFTKKCAFVGTAWYDAHKGVIELESDAYILNDRLGVKNFHNRPDDIAWLLTKIEWAFGKMGVTCPPIKVVEDK